MATRIACFVARKYPRKSSNSPRFVRSFCSSQNGGGPVKDITSIPLSQPLPNFPQAKHAMINTHTYDTNVTTLDNGLKVASENKFGEFCTVGIAIDSGPRYESPFPSGIQHFLEKLAFSSTTEFASRDMILQELERHGGICDCQGSRDTLIYAVSAARKGLSSVVNLLSEVVLRPKLTEEEIREGAAAISFELEALNMRPDPEPLLMEIIHEAGYRNNTLGLPKICSEESLPLINRNIIMTYLKNCHDPSRMVLAGVGVEHNELVQMAEEYFGKKKPIWMEESGIIDASKHLDESLSQYTGGLVKVEKDLSNVSLGPTAMPELAHLVIGLESSSHKHDDFIAFCVLNMMMGGGGSFSAGGPGKGMFTRLYLNVLNKHHWMYNATAYNHAYADSGLFCIHASAHPTKMKELTSIIVKELVNTCSYVSENELNRAKTQLQSMLLMNLESRPVVFEDIARQVLANGCRRPPQWYYDEIGKITEEDIQRVAARMMNSKPAVAALGSLQFLPEYEEIQRGMINRDRRNARRFSLFR
ncbi:mitochondrial-processing peptidase subunit alpha-like [Lineus longissimus]|uniref:mitochondrial-processing peptidase subunit alpha-like n=1 Tax=Lineus longissimus TaxID=88925 RepID=UPI002B4D91AE